MNEIEKKLQKLPVESAPGTLDRRVEETLKSKETGFSGTLSARIPLWACAAACLAFFAGGMLLSRHHTPGSTAETPPAPTEFTIEGSEAFTAVFAAEAAPDDFFLRKKKLINP